MGIIDYYAKMMYVLLICFISGVSSSSSSSYCQGSPLCERNDTYCGEWKGKVWISNKCQYKQYSSEEARQCLKNKTVAFIGDAMIRNLGFALGFLLAGATIDSIGDIPMEESVPENWTNYSKVQHGFVLPQKGSGHGWEWQVQIYYLANRAAIRNPEYGVHQVLSNKMPSILKDESLKTLDFALWNHGLNDYGWFDKHPYGSKYYDQMVGEWLKERHHGTVPCVWVSMNNNCREAYKNGGFYMGDWGSNETKEKGFMMVEDSNWYTHKRLAELGLPYFDAAAPLRSPQRHQVSFNGLYLKMWAELVRANVLLNHLCDENAKWVASLQRFV